MISSCRSMRLRSRILAMTAVLWLTGFIISAGGQGANGQQPGSASRPTIVLVHGDWADASSWNGVVQRLQDRGFTVVAPPNTLRGVSQDAPYLASYLASITGPIVLVAHSYGGFVMTNAATGNDNVKALVYIDAFAPAEGETPLDLIGGTTTCLGETAFNPVPIDGGIDLYLKWEADGPYPGYVRCFANGIDEDTAALLAAEQRPAAAAQNFEPSGPPAWDSIPSWALIGTRDHVIPESLQVEMYERAGAQTTSVKAGHLSLISHPGAVVRLIRSAVQATT